MEPTLYVGSNLDVLPSLKANSVDSIVTDPPYELTGKTGSGGFMGKAWDATGIAYSVEMWAECLRVLKPGGLLLSFGGTRTFHRMQVAIEDAGFEVLDTVHFSYGSGFPKSLNIGKALDKAGNDHAAEWEGWGTALKPSHEPIVVARKPVGGRVLKGLPVDFDAANSRGTVLYFPKANKKERPVVNGVSHATVKPLALMRYLVSIATPDGGVVLDPFAGSGTTLEAAVLEGRGAVGVELTEEHVPLIEARMERHEDAVLDVQR